ncbi:unnamed protein product, partial [Rotaria magnacalcarata]
RLSSMEKNTYRIFSITPPVVTSNQQAVEILQCLQQIKTYIRKQWLLPLQLHNEYDMENNFLK